MDWNKIIQVMGFPTLYALLFIGIGGAILHQNNNVESLEARLILVVGGAGIMLLGVAFWSIRMDVALLRYELNELKKVP